MLILLCFQRKNPKKFKNVNSIEILNSIAVLFEDEEGQGKFKESLKALSKEKDWGLAKFWGCLESLLLEIFLGQTCLKLYP